MYSDIEVSVPVRWTVRDFAHMVWIIDTLSGGVDAESEQMMATLRAKAAACAGLLGDTE